MTIAFILSYFLIKVVTTIAFVMLPLLIIRKLLLK